MAAKEAVRAIGRLTKIGIRSPHILGPAVEPARASMLGLAAVAAWVSITGPAVGPAWDAASRCRWKSAGAALAMAVVHAAGLRTGCAADVAAGQLSSLAT